MMYTKNSIFTNVLHIIYSVIVYTNWIIHCIFLVDSLELLIIVSFDFTLNLTNDLIAKTV